MNDENNYDFPLTFKSWRKNEDKQGKGPKGFSFVCIFALKVAAVSKIVQYKWTGFIYKSNLKYRVSQKKLPLVFKCL